MSGGRPLSGAAIQGLIGQDGGAIVGAAGGRLMSAVSPMVAAGGGNLISRRGSR